MRPHIITKPVITIPPANALLRALYHQYFRLRHMMPREYLPRLRSRFRSNINQQRRLDGLPELSQEQIRERCHRTLVFLFNSTTRGLMEDKVVHSMWDVEYNTGVDKRGQIGYQMYLNTLRGLNETMKLLL